MPYNKCIFFHVSLSKIRKTGSENELTHSGHWATQMWCVRLNEANSSYKIAAEWNGYKRMVKKFEF